MGFPQVRILKWVAISSYRGFSQCRDGTLKCETLGKPQTGEPSRWKSPQSFISCPLGYSWRATFPDNGGSRDAPSPSRGSPLAKGSVRRGCQIWVVRSGGRGRGLVQRCSQEGSWSRFLTSLQWPPGNCPPNWAFMEVPGTRACWTPEQRACGTFLRRWFNFFTHLFPSGREDALLPPGFKPPSEWEVLLCDLWVGGWGAHRESPELERWGIKGCHANKGEQREKWAKQSTCVCGGRGRWGGAGNGKEGKIGQSSRPWHWHWTRCSLLSAQLPASCQVAKDLRKGTRLESATQQSMDSAVHKG